MIYFYSGTPGSGKSLHMAKDIFIKLNTKKQNVIANFTINEDLLKQKRGKFIYCDNCEISPKWLIKYALKNHTMGKEGQTLVCLDECQVLFNPREFTRADRLEWITFFTQHRKLGYNFILVSQNDRLIDRQIRALIEYDVKHRKVNNFKVGIFLPFPAFVSVTYWYGVRERIGAEFFFYRKKLGKLYDSYKMFDNLFKAVVGAVVETPIAVAADIVTLGGALTDQEKPYTAEAASKVVENIQESTKPN